MKINLRRNGLVAALALTGALVLGTSCTNTNKKTADPAQHEVIVVEDGDRYDFNVYTYEQRDQAITGANAELDRMNRQIDEMKADFNKKSEELSDEAKANYEKMIADLEKTRDNYKAEVRKLENATEENWNEAKRDISRTYNDVANSVEKGWENFKEGVSDVAKDIKDGVNKAAQDVKEELR